MPRLFFAVRTPDVLRRELKRLQSNLAEKLEDLGARFKLENLDNSHCTLRFLGSVEEVRIQPLVESASAEMARLKLGAFNMQLLKLGSFTHRGKARVLWVGLSPVETLQTLRGAIDAALASVGIEIEPKEQFHPHLTMIRFREPLRLPENFEFPTIESEPTLVSEVELVESKTLPDGAVHTVRALFEL